MSDLQDINAQMQAKIANARNQSAMDRMASYVNPAELGNIKQATAGTLQNMQTMRDRNSTYASSVYNNPSASQNQAYNTPSKIDAQPDSKPSVTTPDTNLFQSGTQAENIINNAKQGNTNDLTQNVNPLLNGTPEQQNQNFANTAGFNVNYKTPIEQAGIQAGINTANANNTAQNLAIQNQGSQIQQNQAQQNLGIQQQQVGIQTTQNNLQNQAYQSQNASALSQYGGAGLEGGTAVGNAGIASNVSGYNNTLSGINQQYLDIANEKLAMTQQNVNYGQQVLDQTLKNAQLTQQKADEAARSGNQALAEGLREQAQQIQTQYNDSLTKQQDAIDAHATAQNDIAYKNALLQQSNTNNFTEQLNKLPTGVLSTMSSDQLESYAQQYNVPLSVVQSLQYVDAQKKQLQPQDPDYMLKLAQIANQQASALSAMETPQTKNLDKYQELLKIDPALADQFANMPDVGLSQENKELAKAKVDYQQAQTRLLDAQTRAYTGGSAYSPDANYIPSTGSVSYPDLAVGTTYRSGQCGEPVNDKILKPNGYPTLGNLLTEKTSLMNSTKPVVNGAFVATSSLYPQYGHTGIVTGINPDGSFNTLEQNNDPAHPGTITVGVRKPTDPDILGYIDPHGIPNMAMENEAQLYAQGFKTEADIAKEYANLKGKGMNADGQAIVKRGDAIKAYNQSMISNGNADFTSILSGSDQELAKQIAGYDYTGSEQTLAKTGKQPSAIMAYVKQLNPNFDPKNQIVAQATMKDFSTSGKSGQNVTAFNTAIEHLGNLNDNISKLNNTNFQPANALMNWYKTATGKEYPNNLKLDAETVSREIAKSYKTSGVLGEQEANEFTSFFGADNSPEQLKGAIKEAMSLMAGKTKTLLDAYNSTAGVPPKTTLVQQQNIDRLKAMGIDPNQFSTTPVSTTTKVSTPLANKYRATTSPSGNLNILPSK